jgi:hypothetical protein
MVREATLKVPILRVPFICQWPRLDAANIICNDGALKLTP